MTIQFSNDTEVVAEADDFNSALAVYKYQNPDHLVYPHVDGTEVHVRVPDTDGEYPDVVVLKVADTTLQPQPLKEEAPNA